MSGTGIVMGGRPTEYGIPDPSTSDVVGEFTGADYGWYFTEKFGELVAWGSLGALQALYVGAFIEELDMHDFVQCPEVIVDSDNGIDEGECGMAYTDEKALIKSYGKLLDGSKNHLRAYVAQIEKTIGEGNYVAQYLTQEEATHSPRLQRRQSHPVRQPFPILPLTRGRKLSLAYSGR